MATGSCLMVHGSRFMDHASRLVAQGSWLMVKKNLALGPPGAGSSAKFFLAMSHEPWARGLQAWAMSLEPGGVDVTSPDPLPQTSHMCHPWLQKKFPDPAMVGPGGLSNKALVCEPFKQSALGFKGVHPPPPPTILKTYISRRSIHIFLSNSQS